MLPLPPNEVHLWFVFTEEVRDPMLLREYGRFLADDERRQEARFYFPRHRRQYLITRALVRVLLSRYAGLAPERWRFTKNAHGRPSVAPEHGAAHQIEFNVSHTDGLILCGITRLAALGVDVEGVHRQPKPDLADRFFSAEEARALRDLPPDAQTERFFHYWTLKESFIKATGKGLSQGLDSAVFRFRDEENDLRLEAGPAGVQRDWRFWLLRPADGWIGAVCAPREDHPQLITRKIVPLAREEALDVSVLSRT